MIDRYTKAVLTVIAVALVALAIQGAVNQSRAQLNNVQKVQICDALRCADVVPLVRASGAGALLVSAN
jgi:hypothetical protein